jgi:uncharacterized protein (DUF433 family)
MAQEVFPGITVDPDVMGGRPVIAGTRIPIEVIVGELAGGSSFEQIMSGSHLTLEEIRAALGYATQVLTATTVYVSPASRTSP